MHKYIYQCCDIKNCEYLKSIDIILEPQFLHPLSVKKYGNKIFSEVYLRLTLFFLESGEIEFMPKFITMIYNSIECDGTKWRCWLNISLDKHKNTTFYSGCCLLMAFSFNFFPLLFEDY